MVIHNLKIQIMISLFYNPCKFLELMQREFIKRISPLCVAYLLEQLQSEGLLINKPNGWHAVKKKAKEFFIENNVEI